MELSKEIVQEYVKRLNQGTGGYDYKKRTGRYGEAKFKEYHKE